jgi:hypothetical protein
MVSPEDTDFGWEYVPGIYSPLKIKAANSFETLIPLF